MDEFTDGQFMTEDTEQIINDTEEFGSETESSELQQIPVPSSPAHEDTELEQNIMHQIPLNSLLNLSRLLRYLVNFLMMILSLYLLNRMRKSRQSTNWRINDRNFIQPIRT